jgi:hypothetical protein
MGQRLRKNRTGKRGKKAKTLNRKKWKNGKIERGKNIIS